MPAKLARNPVIVLEQVSKSFGTQTAVDRLSLAVERGTCFGLTGPNGAGKSTTLRMLYGGVRTDAGRILVDGVDVALDCRAAKRGMGIVPQEDLLDPDLGVRDNLLFHARYSRLDVRAARKMIPELLALVGLEEQAEASTAHLSGGMRRRLVLVRALLGDKGILLLDEPTRGLDQESRHLYLQTLLSLKAKGVTLVLASHDREEIEMLCDQVVRLNQGRVAFSGSPQELFSPPARPVRVAAAAGVGGAP